MKFCELVFELHLPQNFRRRHEVRHFPEIVKSRSKHPKTYKSMKNRKSKIFTKTILFFVYAEESYKYSEE